MELNFVDPPKRGAGRNPKTDWTPVIEALYQFPNKWILAPYTVNNSAQGYRIPQKYANIELAMRNGNNLRKDDPDKKEWEVYLRYVPSIDEDVF